MAKNITQSAAAAFISVFAEETQNQQRMVPANQIVLHTNNIAAEHDTPESIRELADSIEANGLIHPLAVNQIGNNQYRLISGERRYRAITQHLNWLDIPCTVYHNLSSAMEQLILVSANLEAREYSAADKLKLYVQAESALRDMKASGQYKGGIQRGVAALLNVSERQIGKYKAIVSEYSAEEMLAIKNIDEAAKKAKQKKNGSDFRFLQPSTTSNSFPQDVATSPREESSLSHVSPTILKEEGTYSLVVNNYWVDIPKDVMEQWWQYVGKYAGCRIGCVDITICKHQND